jgi:hypothetical protein
MYVHPRAQSDLGRDQGVLFPNFFSKPGGMSKIETIRATFYEFKSIEWQAGCELFCKRDNNRQSGAADFSIVRRV